MEKKPEVSKYSANTRIGYWNETLSMEDEQLKLFLRKRERNELLVQRSRALFCNILKQIELTCNEKGLKYGDVVQIVAPDMPNSVSCKDGNGLALSGLVNEREVDYVLKLANGCQLTMSPCLVPCVRNSFIITSPDDTEKVGEPLLYGDDFALQCYESHKDIPLFVQSPLLTVTGTRGPKEHQPLSLTCTKDRYCRWKALAGDHHIRFETEGMPVPANTRLVINHSSSNKNLAVEFGAWWLTFFGPECGVSAHNYRDIFKRECAENCFIIHTSTSESPQA
ncbi:cilia- and flagella-associated protein 161-like [Ctenocephalides felis]|uniref:cilia- and flagella-associated protein 161-like n=1 Tax=Ctenocephalides felis TaxID=7515 RepID=UPI000E6E16C5|nr:cilia- and flagella-associated protein 161-like [Ctenocephalides felis]